MRIVVVYDRMQENYRYPPSELIGEHFDPGFTPALTPKGMLNSAYSAANT